MGQTTNYMNNKNQILNKQAITAVIVAKNEEIMIGGCLKCLEWCQEILVIDTGSTDQTVDLAEQAGAKVIHFQHPSFAKLRNEAIKHLTTEWFIYIDVDERVTPTLAKEIGVTIETKKVTAIQIRRTNIYFGIEFKHGGWQNDLVTRGFCKASKVVWQGEIHESPQFEGQFELLKSPLLHFSHREVAAGLVKSAAWTPIEAKLLVDAAHPPVTLRTILRKGLAEFLRRDMLQAGYKDGLAGSIEALIQAINRMLVYIQVWEKQQIPSSAEKYQKMEMKHILKF